MNSVAKRTFTGIAVGAAVVAAILCSPPRFVMHAAALLAAAAIFEFLVLLKKKASGPSPASSAAIAAVAVAGIAIILAGLSALPAIANLHGSLMLLYIVAIVKFSDVGGFAFGLASARLMKGRGGNHKLCPSISPGKSWEGLCGSIVFSCTVSCLFIPATHYTFAKAAAFGVAAAILGTAGDLVESKFKRWVGVKDSSALAITNGMGGILDMLDSLLLAPAILAPFA